MAEADKNPAVPSGPEIGAPLPAFTLPNQWGESVAYAPDGKHRSLVLFHRSADW